MYFMYPGPNTEARTGYAQNTQDTYRIQYSEGYTQNTIGYIRIQFKRTPPPFFRENPPNPARSPRRTIRLGDSTGAEFGCGTWGAECGRRTVSLDRTRAFALDGHRRRPSRRDVERAVRTARGMGAHRGAWRVVGTVPPLTSPTLTGPEPDPRGGDYGPKTDM